MLCTPRTHTRARAQNQSHTRSSGHFVMAHFRHEQIDLQIDIAKCVGFVVFEKKPLLIFAHATDQLVFESGYIRAYCIWYALAVMLGYMLAMIVA